MLLTTSSETIKLVHCGTFDRILGCGVSFLVSFLFKCFIGDSQFYEAVWKEVFNAGPVGLQADSGTGLLYIKGLRTRQDVVNDVGLLS